MIKPKFSIVLIAKNETKSLPKCLASLEEFIKNGGEVVLCDTGSTDGTPDLARSYGVSVTEVGERFIKIIDEETAEKINTKFIRGNEEPIVKAGNRLFDFAAARNFVTSLASNDIVCTLDCDEAYTNLNIDYLNQLIDMGFEQFEYQFVYSHDFAGKPAIKSLKETRRKLTCQKTLFFSNTIRFQAENIEVTIS